MNKRTDFDIIDEVEQIRTKNNVNWMDILRLAFRHAPEDARKLMARVNEYDGRISALLSELSRNGNVEGRKTLIEGGEIYLRQLNLDNSLTHYLSWVNDEETTSYMAIRDKYFSPTDLQTYIKSHLDRGNYLCGIFKKTDDLHLGNVLLSDIDVTMRTAVIGILIGKEHWGEGFGSDAVKLMCKYAFDTLKLHRIKAGVMEGNVGSERLFEKVGFARKEKIGDISYYIKEGE